MNNKKKVMLALSGGVDSSVCISLLRDAGYDVMAVVMKMSEAHEDTVAAAQRVADEFSVPLTVLDLKEEFKSIVIDSFLNDYQNARTPNPCIICNPLIKFKYLKQTAEQNGCDFYATGHYARLGFEDGRYFIKTAKSQNRDQSYMLYRLSQDILKNLILPLGELEKDAVRGIATELSLSSANAPDSQENCFIPDNDYASYILNHGGQNKIGDFISPEGKNLGAHKGIIHYTVGQRKGLGIALGKPVFVDSIDPGTGDVRLVYSGGQLRDSVEVENCVYMLKKSIDAPVFAECKIRSAAKPQRALLTPLENGNIRLDFCEKVSAPAKGQSAVFYIDGAVLGGGFII